MGSGSSNVKQDEHYTYADYCAWDTDERYELIDGVPYSMSPTPTHEHQDIAGKLYREFGNYLEGRHCRVYGAPFDVRLNPDDSDDTVVQPDVMVVCDRNKISESGIHGAPDLVIEVLSQSTRKYDSTLKRDKYLQAGVREYWLVDTELNIVKVYLWDENGVETIKVYGENDTAPVGILPGFSVSLKEVFAAAKW